MDIPLLTQTLTIFLAPALPYLLGLAGKAAEAGAKEMGSEYAKRIWAKLRPKVEEKPAALDTARDVAADATDEEARQAFQYQMGKLLKTDAALASEVQRLLEEAGAFEVYQARLEGSGAIAQGRGAVAAGERGVAIGGDVTGGTIVTGDRNQAKK